MSFKVQILILDFVTLIVELFKLLFVGIYLHLHLVLEVLFEAFLDQSHLFILGLYSLFKFSNLGLLSELFGIPFVLVALIVRLKQFN